MVREKKDCVKEHWSKLTSWILSTVGQETTADPAQSRPSLASPGDKKAEQDMMPGYTNANYCQEPEDFLNDVCPSEKNTEQWRNHY